MKFMHGVVVVLSIVDGLVFQGDEGMVQAAVQGGLVAAPERTPADRLHAAHGQKRIHIEVDFLFLTIFKFTGLMKPG